MVRHLAVLRLLLSFWQEHRIQAALQVVTDLILVSLVVHVTGGMDSSLNFLYPLVIIVACILLPRSWAYLTAALAFILYGAVLELNYYGSDSFVLARRIRVTRRAAGHYLRSIFSHIWRWRIWRAMLTAKLRQVDVQLKDDQRRPRKPAGLHENIIQSISGGLITTGLDGRITLVNRRCARVAGAA